MAPLEAPQGRGTLKGAFKYEPLNSLSLLHQHTTGKTRHRHQTGDLSRLISWYKFLYLELTNL